MFITGGSRGIGAATAVRLAELGAKVILTYRQAEVGAEAVVEKCSGLTPGAKAIQLDLLDEDSVRSAFASLDFDRLDILIANAAATALKPLLALKLHQIDKTFAISVRHFLLMVQLAYPLLEKTGGRIIAVSGADTVGYIPSHGLLAAAKAAMETLVYYLACELGPAGVTTVGVLPGFVDTDSIRMMTGPVYEHIKAGEAESHPLREAASPDQVAEAISLLCLDQARWLNGQVVRCDGGGLFAMTGRYYDALTRSRGVEPPPDAPIVGV
ncbi:MAG: SDR family oxidoreductase [Acidimicrobiia bacterium]